MVVAACGNRAPDPSTPCGHIEVTLATCDPAVPERMLAPFREVCPYYVAYEPRPDDGPNNLAALAKLAVETCAKASSCADLRKCFEDQRCQWILTSPTADPSFSCTGKW